MNSLFLSKKIFRPTEEEIDKNKAVKKAYWINWETRRFLYDRIEYEKSKKFERFIFLS